MTMTFHIDRDHDLTVFHLAGETAFEVFTAIIDRYRAAGPTRYELYDCRAFCGATFTQSQLQQLVAIAKRQAAPRPPGSKTAIVVPDALGFGVSRQYQSLADLNDLPWETGVFETVAAARQWLGLPDGSLS
jgi:hypothetical protein